MVSSEKLYERARMLHLSSGIVLAITSLFAFSRPKVFTYEGSIFMWIYHWPEWLRPLFYIVTQFGSGWAVFVAVLLLWITKRRIMAYVVTFASITTFAAVELLKTIIERPRPYIAFYNVIARDPHAAGFGFPSGHSAFSVLLATLLWGIVPKKIRFVLPCLAALVCLSRVYLGVHSILDVLGGVALGLLMGLSVKMPWFKVKSSLARFGIKA